MRLHVDAYFTFFTHDEQKWKYVKLQEPTLLRDVLTRLGIPMDEVYLVVVNGQIVIPEEIFISEQDEVRLYPPIGGG